MKRMIVRISEDTGRNVGRESTRCLVTRKTPCTVVALALVAFSTSALATACSDYRERITAFGALISDFEKNGRFDRPAYGPCVREERPTDISQCCEAGRMKLGYLRVWGHQKVCSYDYGKEAPSLGFDPLGCLPWERLDTSSAAGEFTRRTGGARIS